MREGERVREREREMERAMEIYGIYRDESRMGGRNEIYKEAGEGRKR